MREPATAAMSSSVRHEDGFIHSKDNLRLYWQRYVPESARADVLVLHGYADHGGRFSPLVQKLTASGLAVSLLDFRGHGQSDGRRGHIDSFRDYLDDLDAFYAKARDDAGSRKLFTVAHSHGALITARWLLDNPRHVAGAVFSSPYFKLAMKPPALKIISARLVGKVIPWLPVPTGIGVEQLTADEEIQKRTAADPLYNKAATPRWFNESNGMQEEVLRRASEFMTPLLTLAAGADPIADSRAARLFFDSATSKDKEFKTYDGYRHEIFNEVGRDKPIGDAAAWLLARV